MSGETKALGEKTFPLPLCPLQISHTHTHTHTHTVLGLNPGLHGTGWQLTTSAMAWPMAEEVKGLLYPMLCEFREKHCFLKVSRLHQFTFLVKE